MIDLSFKLFYKKNFKLALENVNNCQQHERDTVGMEKWKNLMLSLA